MSEGGNKFRAWIANPRVLNSITVGFIVALGVLYIGQVNASAAKALAVRDLEDQQAALRVEAQRLDAQIDQLRSLDSVMQRQQFLGLVDVQKTSYIRSSSGSVAFQTLDTRH